MQSLVEAYRLYLSHLGYGITTVQMLPNCLREFLSFTSKSLPQITREDIVDYHIHLQERPNLRRSGGLSEHYIHHHMYALRLFFAWQVESGNLLASPASGLAFASPQSKPRDILSVGEVKELYALCENRLERAVLSVFYGCGLRRSEGEALNLKDLHFGDQLLYVRKGKYAKRRAIPMSPAVCEDLQAYALHERKAAIREQSFFCNQSGFRMRAYAIAYRFKKLYGRSDIGKEISLHNLRHSIATHLLDSGLSVEYVRDFLGHKHLESTQVYIRMHSDTPLNLTT